MRFGNRGELVMVLPVFRAESVEEFVIVVKLRPEEFVTGVVASLDAPEWHLGHYFGRVDLAVRDAYLRANVNLMPWDEIADPAWSAGLYREST